MNLQTTNAIHLAPLQHELEQQLQWVIKVVQNLPEETLHKPSETGGWSIAACLWHLNSYYDYYLPRLAHQFAQPTSFKPFTHGWLGNYFTRMMEPGTHGKKYKAFRDHMPPTLLKGHDAVYEFIQHHECFMQLMQQAYTTNLNSRIPISISRLVQLKIGDVMRFIIAHNKRHLQQAQRNLKN